MSDNLIENYLNLTCDEQFELANKIAANLGYELVEEGLRPDGTASLRDQFAMAALQGIFASSAHPLSAGIPLSDFDITAKHSYLLADSMLKARNEVKEPPCEK